MCLVGKAEEHFCDGGLGGRAQCIVGSASRWLRKEAETSFFGSLEQDLRTPEVAKLDAAVLQDGSSRRWHLSPC